MNFPLFQSRSREKIKALLVGMLLLLSSSAGLAAELLTADDFGLLSGNLQQVALPEVTAFLEDNYGIKFAGAGALSQAEVTVSLDKLSLEKAIKRIFAKMNVVFKYDGKGNIKEISLLPATGEGTNPTLARGLRRNQPPPVIQPQPEPLPEEDTAVDDYQDSEQEDLDNVDDLDSAQSDAEADSSSPDDSAEVYRGDTPPGNSLPAEPSAPRPGKSQEIAPDSGSSDQ